MQYSVNCFSFSHVTIALKCPFINIGGCNVVSSRLARAGACMRLRTSAGHQPTWIEFRLAKQLLKVSKLEHNGWCHVSNLKDSLLPSDASIH